MLNNASEFVGSDAQHHYLTLNSSPNGNTDGHKEGSGVTPRLLARRGQAGDTQSLTDPSPLPKYDNVFGDSAPPPLPRRSESMPPRLPTQRPLPHLPQTKVPQPIPESSSLSSAGGRKVCGPSQGELQSARCSLAKVPKSTAEYNYEIPTETDVYEAIPDHSVSSARILPKNQENLVEKDWYFGSTDLATVEMKLLNYPVPGVFGVRDSKIGHPDEDPYTLMFYFGNQVCKLHIRRRPDKKYALGSQKKDEEAFATVCELIDFYGSNYIYLKGNGQVMLTTPPKK